MGTQVGTPAWLPESVEEQVDVANIWFVIIKRSSEKSAVSRAAANGTCADKDADKHNGQADLLLSSQLWFWVLQV